MAEAAGVPRQGALIVEVAPGSAAESAGLRRGMIIVEANRKPVRGQGDLLTALKELKGGNVALLRVAIAGTTGRELLAVEVP
jgi:serine protease Do